MPPDARAPGTSLLDSAAATSPDPRSLGTTLERYWVTIGALWFRALALPCSIVPLVLSVGPTRAAAPAAVALVLAAGSAYVAHRLVPLPPSRRPLALTGLAIDTAVAAGLNLWAARTIALPATETGFGLFWPMMQGTVILWLAAIGFWYALVVLALGVGVSMIMVATAVVPTAAGGLAVMSYAGWLVLALAVGTVVRSILRSRAQLARVEGRQAGELAERARQLRRIHDTALQTIEGIALLSTADSLDPEERLAMVGRMARSESAAMRQLLEETKRQDLRAELATMVDFTASLGLSARLDNTDPVLPALEPRAHEACTGAVQEALTNARQHARASEVLVEAWADATGLSVEVRDDGIGFDPGGVQQGFGLRHSVAARVAEAGGRAAIHSRPGEGTVIALRFPLPRDVERGIYTEPHRERGATVASPRRPASNRAAPRRAADGRPAGRRAAGRSREPA